jgi:hypothetical protein
VAAAPLRTGNILLGLDGINDTLVAPSVHSNNKSVGGPYVNANNYPDLDVAISRLPSDMNLGSHHVANMAQGTTDEYMQGLFDFECAAFPSTQSYDAGQSIPFVQEPSFGGDMAATTPALSSESETSVPTRPRPVHNCHHCMASFFRAGDLRRHALSHNPNAPRLSCPRAGCGRQFLRMDKLNDHRRRRHH